jgi:hypothetical protein
MTLGQFKNLAETEAGSGWAVAAFDKVFEVRKQLSAYRREDLKYDGYTVDGFSDPIDYFNSGVCEVLEFEGDIYVQQTGELLSNRRIVIVDRAHIVDNTPYTSWLGRSNKEHVGWRLRPDNLMAMGPLDNLVGLQYRVDHLENLKADVFDQIAYPVIKIRGDVEDFDFAPGARIYLGEEGDVGYLQPDATALQADLQIQLLENKMEEMAGAPRQAMGVRTPGEKTAFEVQSLQNSASRIFEHKTAHFERTFLEPILNAMLEVARRNMNMSDTIRVLDDATGAILFRSITKDDITAKGKLVPVGARHFAERARRVQNLTQLYQLKLADPTIAPHLSGKEMAKIMAEELGEPNLYGENISVIEQLETQQTVQEAEMVNQEQLMAAQEMGI